MVGQLLQILTVMAFIRYGLTQDLFDTFLPGLRNRLQRQKAQYLAHYGYVPLYMNPGPDPINDYMGSHFKIRNTVKRFPTKRRYRNRRQLDENAHIKDLLDSFGGMPDSQIKSTTTVRPEETKETTTEEVEVSPTQQNGFYYLLDWNSFLEIDNQNGKRVNLRIQPKFGDPNNFFSVSVP